MIKTIQILFLSLIVISSAFSLVAENDYRYHPQIKELITARWVNPARMNDDAMALYAKAVGISLNDGYKLAAVQFNNNGTAGIYNTSIPDEAPLIVFCGFSYTIAVYQVDQTKELGYVVDCLKPESIDTEHGADSYFLTPTVPEKYMDPQSD